MYRYYFLLTPPQEKKKLALLGFLAIVLFTSGLILWTLPTLLTMFKPLELYSAAPESLRATLFNAWGE